MQMMRSLTLHIGVEGGGRGESTMRLAVADQRRGMYIGSIGALIRDMIDMMWTWRAVLDA